MEVVAAVMTRDDGSVLACRRRPELAAGGLWEFPGGKVEAGETLDGALRREIREELSTQIEVGAEIGTHDTVVGTRTIRLTCLRAFIVGASPTSSTDHGELRWVSRGDLLSLDWAEPDVPFVNLLSLAP